MPAVTSPDGFQTTVVRMPSPGIPGDFAGANIRASLIGGPGAYVASPGGVLVGAMAWANPATGIASSYYQPNSFVGFVHREGQALITQFLGFSGLTIPGGYGVTLFQQGEFWGLFSGGCTPGQKVYASAVGGALSGNTTGNSVTASNTSVTTSGGNTLTLVGSTTGTVAIGQVVVAAGLPAGTYITGGSGTSWTIANYDGTTIPVVTTVAATFYGVQETGPLAGAGSQSGWACLQTILAPVSFTASLAVPAAGVAFGVLTVTAISGSGVLLPGQWISATGGGGLPATANVSILEQLTGTAGSTGTYLTTNTYYTVTSTNTFSAAVGQAGKISSWVV